MKAKRFSMISGRKSLIILGVTALAVTACGGESADDTSADSVTLRLASPLPESGTYGQALQEWADAVSDESDGSVEVDIHTSGSLLDGTDIMPGVADGRADLGLLFSNYHPEQLTLYNAVAAPFVGDNGLATASTFTQLYEESNPMQEQFTGAGVEPLAFLPNGSASTGTTGPISAPEDLGGQRIRVPGTVGDILSTVGADAVFLELVEMYEGVSRGVVDGWSGTDFPTAMTLDLGEVTPEVTDLGIGQYASGAIIMNIDQRDSLSDEQQDVLARVSGEYPEAYAETLTEIDIEACETLSDAGGHATRLSDDEVERFRQETEEAVREDLRQASVNAGLSEDEHDEFMDRYVELMDSYDNPENYTDGLSSCIEQHESE